MMKQLFQGSNNTRAQKESGNIYEMVLSGKIRTKYPAGVITVLQMWESSPGLHQWQCRAGSYPQYLTKAIQFIDKLLQGRAFVDNPFLAPYSDIVWTTARITEAIIRYHAAACDPTFYPANIDTKKHMRKKTIMDFLWCAPYENAVADIWARSPLIYYHLNPPMLNDDSIPKKEAPNQAFFDMFVAMFVGCTPCRICTVRDHNLVVGATARYYTWYQENKAWLAPEQRSASFIIEKIKERLQTYNPATVKLVNVCSPRLFNDMVRTISLTGAAVLPVADIPPVKLPKPTLKGPLQNHTTPLCDYASGTEVQAVQNYFRVRGETCPPLNQFDIVANNHMSAHEMYSEIVAGRFLQQEQAENGPVDRLEWLQNKGNYSGEN